jgi:hypothetical protein
MKVQNNNLFDILIGEKLSSVTFVMDYLQIDFDGNRFTLNIFPIIKSRGHVFKFGKQFYRDNLCELIGKVVSSIEVKNEEVLTIVFDSANYISVLLASSTPEITFPEIAVFVNTKNETFVF